MEPRKNARPHTDGSGRPADEIDEKYSEVDPDDVAENAIDYFSGDPETESEKATDGRLVADGEG